MGINLTVNNCPLQQYIASTPLTRPVVLSVIPHFEQGGLFKPHLSHKMVGQAPYLRATLPEWTQVQVWPYVISQSSPHLFSASLPVTTSCPIQIKALKKKKKYIFFFFFFFLY